VSAINVLGKFFSCYLTDWVSDVYVLYSNYNLSMHVDKALSGNVTLGELHELGISRKAFLNAIPWDTPGFLLNVSMLLTLRKVRHLKALVKV
jgi:hypothetical protein